MLSLACLGLMVVKLAEGTGTCEGNETTGLLQLQKHQARLAGLEILQGCCVVVDASNMSSPTLNRTEMGSTDECYSNVSEAEDPAGYIHYFTRGCPDTVIEGILDGFNLEVGRDEEAVPGQPQTPEAPSLALTALKVGSSARTAASNYVVFESFENRAWPEPDPLKIAYQSSSRGSLRSGGAEGTATSLGPLLDGGIWRSPAFPITSSLGTTLQAWIRTPPDTAGTGGYSYVRSHRVSIGFDTDPALTGTKMFRLWQVCYPNSFCEVIMQAYDRPSWGWSFKGQTPWIRENVENQWLRLLIQVVSTQRAVARLYDASGNLRGTLAVDFSISPSGTAFVAIDTTGFGPNNDVLVDELATCAATFNKELSTDTGRCTSSQDPFLDPCTPGVTHSCSPSPLPVGRHEVLCQFSDGPNTWFETEVKDTELPILTKNFGRIEETTCGETAQVFFEVQATDNCDTLTPTCIPPSGSLFPLGTTTVTCTAQDSAGNAAIPMSFSVVVEGDTTPPGSPVISPGNPTGDAGSCGDTAEVIFDATFTDVCQPVNVLCIPTSGSSFQLGSTPVECTAADPSGNTGKVNFDVTVTGGDNVAPDITQLADINDVTTCGETAQVTFVVEASDACDGPVTPTCIPPSGSLFPVGTTVVTCTAQDSAGNAATPMSFQVTVEGDTTPPAFDPTPVDRTADAGCGDFAQVSFEAQATDGCGPPHVTCTPPTLSLFPVGSTTVQCTATDASGNAATENFEVTVARSVEAPSFGPTSDVEARSPYCRVMRVQFEVPVIGCGATAECFPASGSLFRLGKTPVTCTASNDAGSAETSFNVHVSCDAPPPGHRHWGYTR